MVLLKEAISWLGLESSTLARLARSCVEHLCTLNCRHFMILANTSGHVSACQSLAITVARLDMRVARLAS